MSFIKQHSFKIAVIALVLALGAYLFYSYVWSPSEPLPIEKAAPAFEMEDIDGNVVSLDNTAGKARIVYFYFANCPDVCPPTTFLLSEAQEKLIADKKMGSEVEFISITFDPERDTPDVIRSFAERNFAKFDGWHFLRGEEEPTIKLAEEYGVGVMKIEEQNTFAHYNFIILVDQNNQIRKWFNGSDEELTADDIVKDIKSLL
ncbi:MULTISPECIES: SCO family protein [unclassified Paenibacillus]|uniref:SCO family protein n=1 Tax=unclassified Paenibacillus TaxID=185978 RepID=UPI002F41BA92